MPAVKVFVPSFYDEEKRKAFCKRNSLPTKHLNASKWCSALKQIDLPENGGLIDVARLKVFAAVLKS